MGGEKPLRHRFEKGVTLLEIMVVLAIMAIAASFVIPALGQWKRKFDVENTIKMVFSALNEARMTAFSQKRACGLVWSGTPITSVSLKCDGSANGTGQDGDITDATDEVLWTKQLKVPLQSDFPNNRCVFTYKGFADSDENGLSDTNPQRHLYYGSESDSEYTCVAVSLVRIRMGEWDLDHNTCTLK